MEQDMTTIIRKREASDRLYWMPHFQNHDGVMPAAIWASPFLALNRITVTPDPSGGQLAVRESKNTGNRTVIWKEQSSANTGTEQVWQTARRANSFILCGITAIRMKADQRKEWKLVCRQNRLRAPDVVAYGHEFDGENLYP